MMLEAQGDVQVHDNPFFVSDHPPPSLLSNNVSLSSQEQGTEGSTTHTPIQHLVTPEASSSSSESNRCQASAPLTAHDNHTSLWPSDSAILVAVRVRPFNNKERAHLAQAPAGRFNFSTEGSLSANYHAYVDPQSASSGGGKNGTKSPTIRKVVNVLDERVLVFDPPDSESITKYKRGILPVQAYRKFKDMRYAFDRVFHEDAQQEEVFRNTTRHLIDGVLGGYNGTLFAYGATGCGKTHTISGTPEKPGIIYLTMQELYERIKDVEDEKTFEISVSYLEVYNEALRDLLAEPLPEGAKPVALHMREDANKRISITGLSEHHPHGMDEVMELISRGNSNRTMSPTEANATSSRSHAVLQINICQRLKTANVNEDFTMATLSLIDLAGSERASATRNRGERMLEGANINKSLLALGNCINALCDHRRGKAHIPYRDSKLTRLLKFSLGGNCKTVMIACVSPSSQHYEETHNTLKYANRAKNITTKVTKNTLNVDRHVSEYVQAIYELRQEVGDLKLKLQRQNRQENFEKVRLQQESYRREFEDTVHKVRATFQTARDQETGYAQLQAKLFVLTERLSTLHHWRSGFEESKKKAIQRRDQIEQELGAQDHNHHNQASTTSTDAVANLNSSISKASSYLSVVDDLIDQLKNHILELSSKMQDQEDALKMYAVGIQTMERQADLAKMGFPFERLYELEKKCQALESHNKILTTKLELSDQALSEQFGALKDFMELNARSLVGLRPEIGLAGEQGRQAVTLNDIYMSAISSFTDMTRRVQTMLPAPPGAPQQPLSPHYGDDLPPSSPSTTPFSNNPLPSPLRKTIGLKGSRIMSILPDVPQTPVKKRVYTATNILPHVAMDTVDTNVALGTSSLFGDQSPIRLFSGGIDSADGDLHAPNHNSPSHNRIVTTPRKKPSPLPGVIFSPVRKRARGGLRQPRLAPTPTKRNVNFSLDVVEEDDERLTTGVRDPTSATAFPNSMMAPPARPLVQLLREASRSSSSPASSTSSPATMDQVVSPTSASRATMPSTPRSVAAGLSGGARRVIMPAMATEAGTSGGARRITHAAKGELGKGPQRVVGSSNRSNIAGGASSSPSSSTLPFANYVTSPVKRARQLSSAVAGHDTGRGNGKRVKSSPPSSSFASRTIASVRAITGSITRSPEQQQAHMNTTGQGGWSSMGNTSPSAVDVKMRDNIQHQNSAIVSSSIDTHLPKQPATVASGFSPPTSRLATMSFSVRTPTVSLPPSADATTAPASVTASATNVNINTSKPTIASFAAATVSSASRRRSLGGSLLLQGSAGVAAAAARSALSTNSPRSTGGGPIRDAGLRRKLRGAGMSTAILPTPSSSGSGTGLRSVPVPNITPPKEIPTYQQILQKRSGVLGRSIAGGASRRLSFRPTGGRLSPLRAGGASTGASATAVNPTAAATTTLTTPDASTSKNITIGSAEDGNDAIKGATPQPQQQPQSITANISSISNSTSSSRRKSALPVPIKHTSNLTSGPAALAGHVTTPEVASAATNDQSALLGSSSFVNGTETVPAASTTLSALMASTWDDIDDDTVNVSRRRMSLPAHRLSTKLTLEEIECEYDTAKERVSRRRSMLPT